MGYSPRPKAVPDLPARVEGFGSGSGALSAAFSPVGLLVASGHMAEGIRIFNALTGIEQARLTGQDGAFRCRRHDECSLAFCRSGTPFLEPLPLPLRDAPAALGAGIDPGLPEPIAVSNGELAKVRVRVHKPGAEPVYWIRLVPKRSTQDRFVL